MIRRDTLKADIAAGNEMCLTMLTFGIRSSIFLYHYYIILISGCREWCDGCHKKRGFKIDVRGGRGKLDRDISGKAALN
jgi:hypothetical protein